jgi:hypothetical protein
MNLSNEAAYLYVLSKEIEGINRQIRRISKKADKHRNKHFKVAEHKKGKHKAKYDKAVEELKLLLKEHNKILTRLRGHHIAFAGGLDKQRKI